MEDVAVPFMYDRMMNQNQLSIEDYQQHFIDALKQKHLQLIYLKALIRMY